MRGIGILKYKSKSKSQLLELITPPIKSADEIPADLQSVKHPQNLIISTTTKNTKADEPAPRQYTFIEVCSARRVKFGVD
jgi:hypothetical protein